MERELYPENCIHDKEVPCYLYKYQVTRTRPCESMPCRVIREYQKSGILLTLNGNRTYGNGDTISQWSVKTTKPESEVREYLQRYFNAKSTVVPKSVENLKAVDGGFSFDVVEPYRD